MIEYYHFGLNHTNSQEKIGHFLFGQGYWDVETIQYIYYNDRITSEYRRFFCSSVRSLSEIKVPKILKSGKR